MSRPKLVKSYNSSQHPERRHAILRSRSSPATTEIMPSAYITVHRLVPKTDALWMRARHPRNTESSPHLPAYELERASDPVVNALNQRQCTNRTSNSSNHTVCETDLASRLSISNKTCSTQSSLKQHTRSSSNAPVRYTIRYRLHRSCRRTAPSSCTDTECQTVPHTSATLDTLEAANRYGYELIMDLLRTDERADRQVVNLKGSVGEDGRLKLSGYLPSGGRVVDVLVSKA